MSQQPKSKRYHYWFILFIKKKYLKESHFEKYELKKSSNSRFVKDSVFELGISGSKVDNWVKKITFSAFFDPVVNLKCQGLPR